MGMALEGTVILRYADLINNGFRSWSIGVPQNDPEDLVCSGFIFPDFTWQHNDVSRFNAGAEVAFYGPPAIGGSVICLQFHFNQSQRPS